MASELNTQTRTRHDTSMARSRVYTGYERWPVAERPEAEVRGTGIEDSRLSSRQLTQVVVGLALFPSLSLQLQEICLLRTVFANWVSLGRGKWVSEDT